MCLLSSPARTKQAPAHTPVLFFFAFTWGYGPGAVRAGEATLPSLILSFLVTTRSAGLSPGPDMPGPGAALLTIPPEGTETTPSAPCPSLRGRAAGAPPPPLSGSRLPLRAAAPPRSPAPAAHMFRRASSKLPSERAIRDSEDCFLLLAQIPSILAPSSRSLSSVSVSNPGGSCTILNLLDHKQGALAVACMLSASPCLSSSHAKHLACRSHAPSPC